MTARLSVACLLLIIFSVSADLPSIGQRCTKVDGMIGICTKFRECKGAKARDVIKRINICESHNNQHVICCELPEARRKSEDKCEEYGNLTLRKNNFNSLSLFFEPSTTYEKKCLKSTGLVVGGNESLIGEFPHAAALGLNHKGNKVFKCGGSLISERYVLTAAHCNQVPFTFVRLGYTNLYSSSFNDIGVDYEIEEFIAHNQYDEDHHDIGLIRLKDFVMFTDKIRPACLWQTKEINYTKAIAIGWGLTEAYGESSDTLMKVELYLYPERKLRECANQLSTSGRVEIISSQICANGGSGKDTCQGDSGGPLQVTTSENQCLYHIIGITSYGVGCGFGLPGVYTKVFSYLDWIENIVWD